MKPSISAVAVPPRFLRFASRANAFVVIEIHISPLGEFLASKSVVPPPVPLFEIELPSSRAINSPPANPAGTSVV